MDREFPTPTALQLVFTVPREVGLRTFHVRILAGTASRRNQIDGVKDGGHGREPTPVGSLLAVMDRLMNRRAGRIDVGDTFREGAAHTNCMLRGMELNEIRDVAVEVRENAETLVDGEVDALNDAKYLAAQVASLAHAVEELAKKIGNV